MYLKNHKMKRTVKYVKLRVFQTMEEETVHD